MNDDDNAIETPITCFSARQLRETTFPSSLRIAELFSTRTLDTVTFFRHEKKSTMRLKSN